jgi:hypothetical protein
VRDHAGAEIAAQGMAEEVEILRADPAIEASSLRMMKPIT